MSEYLMPRSACPKCGRPFDAATNMSGEGPPSPGDVTVCIGCVAILVFDGHLVPRLANEEEIAEIHKNPEVRRVIGAMKLYQRRRSAAQN